MSRKLLCFSPFSDDHASCSTLLTESLAWRSFLLSKALRSQNRDPVLLQGPGCRSDPHESQLQPLTLEGRKKTLLCTKVGGSCPGYLGVSEPSAIPGACMSLTRNPCQSRAAGGGCAEMGRLSGLSQQCPTKAPMLCPFTI